MEEKDIIDIDVQPDYVLVTFKTASISVVSGADAIATQLQPIIAQSESLKIIVDFAGVKFFSSTILGMLVNIWQKLKETKGTLVISGIDPQLYRVFRITCLDKIFKFYPDRQAAIEALKTL